MGWPIREARVAKTDVRHHHHPAAGGFVPEVQSRSIDVISRFQLASLSLQSRRIVMVLVIDNYDSFTYNLVQYLGELNVEMEVHRNDQITLARIRGLNPERILISPGPCSPRESGLSNDIILEFGRTTP